MGPVLAQFFGMPLDVRHVTLSTGTLVAAVSSLDWSILAAPEFWLAAGGIVVIGLLNVGVAFGCALGLALRAREVPTRIRRAVFRAVLRRFTTSPWSFLFPQRQDRALSIVRQLPLAPEPVEQKTTRSKTGS
jgi:site-specific recombinase